MNAYPALPERFAWNAEQLADAVPRRLSELCLFDPSATRDAGAHRAARGSFVPATQARLFRVGG